MGGKRANKKAFYDLLKAMKGYEKKFRNRRFLTNDNELAEGYSAMLDLLSVGLDCYVYNSPLKPRFIQLVSPERKIGGDNADALYYFAPLLPGKGYKITGTVGEAVYVGFTIYGGETPKKFHIVSNLSIPEGAVAPDGTFEIVIAPEKKEDQSNVLLTDDTASCLIIRRYYLGRTKMTTAPGTQEITAEDPAGIPGLLTGSEMRKRIRDLEQFLRGWFRLTPIPMPPVPAAYNRTTPPRPASEDTGHWSTPDNMHSFALFKLKENEALYIRGRSPQCLYWSVHLWNPYLQTYDYVNHQCALNSADIALKDDGSWEIMISCKDTGHPNWVSTTGHPRGMVYFRWLKAESTPEKLESEVKTIL